jgi:Flp pilus assembly protein TadD
VKRRNRFWLVFTVFAISRLLSGVAHAFPGPPPGTFLPEYFRYASQGSNDLSAIPWDETAVEREIARLADRVRPALAAAGTGEQVVAAFHRALFVEERFAYDPVAGDPDNFLPAAVLLRKRGNCLGLSMLYLALAERLQVPFRGVCLPSHCFIRYEGTDGARNVEFAPGGEGWEDDRYRKEFRIGAGRPYLRSLAGTEMLGVFLSSLGAAYSRRGREEDALRLYGDASRFFPGLPEAHFNAGFSLQRLGRVDEAAGRYRLALSLDPDLAPARDNLGIVLAMQGKYPEAIAEGRRAVELEPRNAAMRGNLASTYVASGDVEAGIREFRKVVEISPDNPRARAGLAMAYIALGRYEEGSREFDEARSLGVRFAPAVREEFERRRPPAHPES